MSRISKSHKAVLTNLAAVAAVALAIALIAVKNLHVNVPNQTHNASYYPPHKFDRSGGSLHQARSPIGEERPADAVMINAALKPRTP